MKNIVSAMCDWLETSQAAISLTSPDPGDKNTYDFIQRQVGDAKFAYMLQNTGKSPIQDPKFIAIWKSGPDKDKGTTYIFNELCFDPYVWSGKEWLPEGAVSARDEVKRIQKNILEEEFPKIYESVALKDISETTDTELTSYDLQIARESIFWNNGVLKIHFPDIKISLDTLANILCGATTIEAVAKSIYSLEYWSSFK